MPETGVNLFEDLFGNGDSEGIPVLVARGVTEDAASESQEEGLLSFTADPDFSCDTQGETVPEIDLDLSDLEVVNEDSVSSDPADNILFHPITGQRIDLLSADDVVKFLASAKSELQILQNFESDLRRAAVNLTTSKTMTRRLSAVVDGQMVTLVMTMPGDTWDDKSMGVVWEWCGGKKLKEELESFRQRFIRVKQKYEPVAKEVKKLLAENFPEGSVLEIAKRKLLSCNKGSVGKLPSVKVETSGGIPGIAGGFDVENESDSGDADE